MIVVGSLPQLTSWGGGCEMVKANGTWQYDLLLGGAATPSTVIEFLYKYVAVHPGTNMNLWESRISRCRLQLDKLLDHVFSPNEMRSSEHGNVKVVFQANGIPACAPQIDLLLTGSTTQLGEWDIKKAKVLKKAPIGTFFTTVYVQPGTSFLYAYFLIRNSRTLFEAGSPAFEVGDACNSAMLWSSGVGRIMPVDNIDAVVQLLDEWEQASSLLQDAIPAQVRSTSTQALKYDAWH